MAAMPVTVQQHWTYTTYTGGTSEKQEKKS